MDKQCSATLGEPGEEIRCQRPAGPHYDHWATLVYEWTTAP